MNDASPKTPRSGRIFCATRALPAAIAEEIEARFGAMSGPAGADGAAALAPRETAASDASPYAATAGEAAGPADGANNGTALSGAPMAEPRAAATAGSATETAVSTGAGASDDTLSSGARTADAGAAAASWSDASGAAEGAVVLLTDPGVGADIAAMDRLPGLGLVACYGVGTDAIDLKGAALRGVQVSNTPGLLADAVADHAMALLLASARGVVQADRFIRDGHWTRLWADLPLGRGLRGRRLGIVGLGAIGRAIAERAAGFGIEIAWHGPRPKPDAPWRHEPDLLRLATESDVLILACRGGPETHHLITAAVLDALGPGGTLVNVARGSVVDESALVAALGSGRLGFAALDVFEDEPKVPEALRRAENVVLTPHQGSASIDTRLAMGRLLIDNIAAFLEGRPLPTPVALPAPPASAPT